MPHMTSLAPAGNGWGVCVAHEDGRLTLGGVPQGANTPHPEKPRLLLFVCKQEVAFITIFSSLET